MAQKKKSKITILPDIKYNSVEVAKFINHIMKDGKKTTAQKIIYGAFDIIEKKTKSDPLEIFHKAIENVKPKMELRPMRVGGATYQVPIPVNEKRQESLAMRWILNVAKSKKGRSMQERLAEELILSSKNEGAAVKKKQDTHRMAEANRAFAHLARR
ncbi:MAG: 30S ribosomal protein S7 [Candidatus Pacebacteria bacterium]|nr:30S ribosomal protein S7 [Candidatus Paceibacterota bacterium]